MIDGDLTTLDNARQWLGLGGVPIAGITQAAQAVVTTVQQSAFLSGMPVQFSGVQGMTELNGNTYTLTVIDSKNFSIAVDSTGFGAYTAGGFASISDPLLSRLIKTVSVYIQTWLNRTIASQTYTETRNGNNGQTMMFKNFPVSNVRSVTVNGIAIQQRPPLGLGISGVYGFSGAPNGYVFDDVSIMLDGCGFLRGFQNVLFVYDAGFLIANEPQTIPAVAPYTLTTLSHWSAGDAGVIYAGNAVPFLHVTTPPLMGQYNVAGSVYTFNAADAGADVLISYGYVPSDLEQAAIDIIGDWFRYKDRIGKLSEAIEGQSITFTNQAITARAQGVLNQYRSVAPIA